MAEAVNSGMDGWVGSLQDNDIAPGQQDSDQNCLSNGWADDNPGQRKAVKGVGAHGDGLNGVIAKDDPTSSRVSSYYEQTNAGNTFPKGSGPDAEAQNLRGYALNEPPSNGAVDYEMPKKGPLNQPRLRTPNTMNPLPLDTVSKVSTPTSPRRTFTPDTPGPGVPSATPRRGGNQTNRSGQAGE